MIDPAIALIVFFSIVLLVFVLWNAQFLKQLFVSEKKRTIAMKEDVMKALFKVDQNKQAAGLDALSNALRIPSSKLLKIVTQMTTEGTLKLSEDKLILTDEGKSKALQIIRRHRLWETYLAEKTGIRKEEWHELAEKKEHELTVEETEKLYQALGNPRFDPHGDPIPTATGEMAQSPTVPLSNFPVGTPAKIAHIEDEPKVVYRQIIDEDLFVGSHLKVLSSNDHEVVFHCEGERFALSPIVASNIGVIALSEQEVIEEVQSRLSSLEPGETAKVLGIASECRGPNRRRLLDLGFVPDTVVNTEYEGPLKYPKAYMVRNTLIALRKDQADLVLIEKEK